MSTGIAPIPAGFPILLREIKARIQQAQTRAILSANAELVRLYWDIGRLIDERQRQEGWGAAVIPRLARALRNELPEEKGFSERNIKRMLAFYREYPDPPAAAQEPPPARFPELEKVPPPVAHIASGRKVPQAVALSPDALLGSIPWAHHVILIEKVKDLPTRLWYMQQTLANGWSRNVLLAMIQSQTHRRQGRAITNFDRLRHAHDSPSIGLILCQDKNHIVAEYALRDMNKPIGVSEYELTRALPPSLQSALPSVEEIEAELSESAGRRRPKPGRRVETQRARPSPPAKKKPSRRGRRT